MTTTRHRPTWDLALDPLVSCKLCLGEYPLEQMTTVAQCQCVFCTLVGPCWRRHRVKGCRRVSLRLRFASPDRKPRPVPLPGVKGAPPPVPTPQVSLWALEWARPPPRGCAPGAGGGSGRQRDGVWKRAGVRESRPCALAVWKETPRSSLWPHGARLASPERVRRSVRPAPPGGAPGGSACARPEVTFRCPQAEPAPPGAKRLL